MTDTTDDAEHEARNGRRATRGTYDPVHTRALLLESALDLFGTQGFHATSVQQIVDAAGLTKGAFYHHFASKEDILRRIHDDFLDVQRRMVDEILAEQRTPTDQLREIIRHSVLSVAAYQSSVTVFFQERRYLTGDRAREVRRARDELEALIEAVIRAGIEAGEFSSSVNPRVAVFGIVGLSAWTHQWYRPGGALTAEQIADDLASLALDGLAARAR